MINTHTIEVEILGDINNGYRLKVSVLDLGLYVFGFTARSSDKNVSGWWIQPPAQMINGRWKSVIEFDKSKTLFTEIEQAVIDAINSQGPTLDTVYMPQDEELTDEAIKNSLDKATELFDKLPTKPIKPKSIYEGLS